MFNADPYLAERSMALHVADAHRQAAIELGIGNATLKRLLENQDKVN